MQVTVEEYRAVESFIYKEARLADESKYSDWEDLVDDDMHYWVPLSEGQEDGVLHASIMNDNRSRVASRIKQLNTGNRHAQLPVSRMRRTVANIEVEKEGDDVFIVSSNVVIYEVRLQTGYELATWPARVVHKLRKKDGGFKMFQKKVMLLNSEGPVKGFGVLI